jgi:hypothetical protein
MMVTTVIQIDEIQARIAALDEAIASGAKRIVFYSSGSRREIEYNSLNDMLRALAYLKSQLPETVQPGSRTFASYSSGL